jgi:U6 snRNA-associated Sm-like protein LSm7
MDFSHLLDRKVLINFVGGRELFGTLKSYDQVSNLIIEDSVEILRDPNDIRNELSRRELGTLIVRGPNVRTLKLDFKYFSSRRLSRDRKPF